MSPNAVCGVIVTFRPRAQDFANLAKLRPQVEKLVVVDNGSSDQVLQQLRTASHELDFELIENGSNLGMGAALNIGVKWAQANGAKWIALFDQDSSVTDGFIVQMLVDFEYFQTRRNVMLLIPRYKDPQSGVERVCGLDKDGGPFVTITSGSLLPVTAFETCGYFNEDLFIYTVDDEYSLRLRSQGYFIGLSPHAVLLHASGIPSYYRIFGKPWFQTTNYGPGVRYYISRNRIWMTLEYGARYPRWVRGALRASFIDLCRLAIAEDYRWAKVKMVFLGFRDGMLGRMGKTVTL